MKSAWAQPIHSIGIRFQEDYIIAARDHVMSCKLRMTERKQYIEQLCALACSK